MNQSFRLFFEQTTADPYSEIANTPKGLYTNRLTSTQDNRVSGKKNLIPQSHKNTNSKSENTVDAVAENGGDRPLNNVELQDITTKYGVNVGDLQDGEEVQLNSDPGHAVSMYKQKMPNGQYQFFIRNIAQ